MKIKMVKVIRRKERLPGIEENNCKRTRNLLKEIGNKVPSKL